MILLVFQRNFHPATLHDAGLLPNS